MKIVLFVEHDAAERQRYADVLTRYHANFELLSAADTREALELLESCAVDLVVADLDAPGGATLELLAALQRHHPEVGVLLRLPEPPKASAPPNVALLEPPVTPSALAETVLLTLERPQRGVTLADLLVVLELARHTCTLRVESEDQTGVLYLIEGEVREAHLGDVRGPAARDMVLGLPHPRVTLAPYQEPHQGDDQGDDQGATQEEHQLEPVADAATPDAPTPDAATPDPATKEKVMSEPSQMIDAEAEKLVETLRRLQARVQAADEALGIMLGEVEALREHQRRYQQARAVYLERQARLEQLRQGAEQLAQQLLLAVKQEDEEHPEQTEEQPEPPPVAR